MRVNHRNVAYFASCNSHVDKEGFLQKFSEHKGTYQSKWFLLKGNILFYFDKKGDREPQGAIVLEGCRIELADTAEGLHAFQLSFSGEASKDYRLVADSPESMESWMKALSCATYDYMKAVVDELQRQMDEISHHVGGEVLQTDDGAQNTDETGSAENHDMPSIQVAHSDQARRSRAIVRATFPSESGSTLKSAAFPNPLYDVLDEVPTSPVSTSMEKTTAEKEIPSFAVNRSSSDSDSESEEAGLGGSDDLTYANLNPHFQPGGGSAPQIDFENVTYLSASLEDVSLSSSSTMKGRSLNMTHSESDLQGVLRYAEKETLPISKSAVQMREQKKVPPQKPPRIQSFFYENMAGFASGLNSELSAWNQRLSDIPSRASNKFFHREKFSEVVRTEDRGRSMFHVREVRSFPEMHQDFGVLVIKKVNAFRQRKGQSR